MQRRPFQRASEDQYPLVNLVSTRGHKFIYDRVGVWLCLIGGAFYDRGGAPIDLMFKAAVSQNSPGAAVAQAQILYTTPPAAGVVDLIISLFWP